MAWQLYAGLAAYQIISGSQQAEGIRANAALTREINDLNAKYAELDAFNAEATGEAQAARYDNTINEVEGQQKVGFAARDVDVNFGTAKEVQEESKLIGFLNKMDIRNHAHKVAMGYKDQARNFRLAGITGTAQGAYNASATQNAAMIGAASSIVKGIESYQEDNRGLSGYEKDKPTEGTERTRQSTNLPYYKDESSYLSGDGNWRNMKTGYLGARLEW